MSSTNETEQKIQALFDHHILALQGKNYLLTTIDKQADSYFETPKHLDQAYFSFIDTASAESFATYLNDFWTKMNNPEFAAMASEISKLAFLLSANHSAQSEDVSPFVYTMY